MIYFIVINKTNQRNFVVNKIFFLVSILTKKNLIYFKKFNKKIKLHRFFKN